jgi:hypothetical protein
MDQIVGRKEVQFDWAKFNPNSAIEKSWCIVGCKKLSGSEGIG